MLMIGQDCRNRRRLYSHSGSTSIGLIPLVQARRDHHFVRYEKRHHRGSQREHGVLIVYPGSAVVL